MHVVELLNRLLSTVQVTIVTTARLPESVFAALIHEAAENRRMKLPPSTQNMIRSRALDVAEYPRHRSLSNIGPQQQMHMLGHDHPAEQSEAETLAATVESLDKYLFDRIVVKQRKPAKAGKCEKAEILWILIAAPGLAVTCIGHAPRIRDPECR